MKFITNNSGKIESVVLPVKVYKAILELLEDIGLGIAMNESQNDIYMNKDKALKILEK